MVAVRTHPQRLGDGPRSRQQHRDGDPEPRLATAQVRSPAPEHGDGRGRQDQTAERLRQHRQTIEQACDEVQARARAGADEGRDRAGEEGGDQGLGHEVERLAQEGLVGEYAERDDGRDQPTLPATQRRVRDQGYGCQRELLEEREKPCSVEPVEPSEQQREQWRPAGVANRRTAERQGVGDPVEAVTAHERIVQVEVANPEAGPDPGGLEQREDGEQEEDRVASDSVARRQISLVCSIVPTWCHTVATLTRVRVEVRWSRPPLHDPSPRPSRART